MLNYDIAIIGAGIAGASLAAAIGGRARVVLLEAEAQPGYHATGRSAAFWTESYGGPIVQPLTTASQAFLAAPPTQYSERSLLAPRGALTIARTAEQYLLAAMRADFAGSTVDFVDYDRAALVERIPGLRPGWTAGLGEASCQDIDVAAYHQACLAVARRNGARLICQAKLSAIRAQGDWQLETAVGLIRAQFLVNAAGAWASVVAKAANAQAIPIQPLRRTILQLAVDPPVSADLPLVLDAAGKFYFKPEAGGRLWLSPHDETPYPPGDVAAEELDVAIAIDRLQQVVDWRIIKRERVWAGLRSFAPDRVPVYGFDAHRSKFFWFAGQGGFGIQTAPAAAALGAALLLGEPPPAMVGGIDPLRFSPQRFV
jgi:D-arginine dehydrogenase